MKHLRADTNWSIDLSIYIVSAVSALVFALANGPGEKSTLTNAATFLILLSFIVFALVRVATRLSITSSRIFIASLLSLILVIPIVVDASHFGFFRSHMDQVGINVALDALSSGEVLVNTWGGLWFLLLVIGWVLTCWIVGKILYQREIKLKTPGIKTWILRSCCLCLSLTAILKLPEEATAIFNNSSSIKENFVSSDTNLGFDVMTERNAFRELRERFLALTPSELKAEKTPNILIIHVESLRWDMLTPELMPKVTAWINRRQQSQSCITPSNHFSTGNNSGIGMFGILSGLPGYYHHIFKREHQPPLGLNILTKIGYQFNFFAASDCEFDDIYQNLVAPLAKHSVRLGEPKSINFWKADQEVIKKYKDFLVTSENSSPRFDYLVWNSTHYNYYYPPEFEKFTPVMGGAEEITPVALALLKSKPERAKNRFKNSVYFADHEIGELLESLETSGALNNSIVILLGDHGEEFFEHGRFAHTFGLSSEQTRVAAALCFPSTVKSDYQFASHHDILPSIFEYIGVDQKSRSLLGGKSLLGTRVKPDFALTSMSSSMTQLSLDHMVIDNRYKVQFINKGLARPKAVYDLDDNKLATYDSSAVGELLRFAFEIKIPDGLRKP